MGAINAQNSVQSRETAGSAAEGVSVVADDVGVVRGGRRVLSDVSFSVTAGHALAVKGPNGSGKSTLLRAIAGLLPLADGTITINGGAQDAPGVHHVGHLNATKLALSVRDNASFWQRWFSPNPDEERVEDALTAVGLIHLADVPAAFLSQGQRRRLSLSRLHLAPRAVWLLDEPVAGLDAASQTAFAAMMERHLSRGGLIIAATHDPLDAAPLVELTLG